MPRRGCVLSTNRSPNPVSSVGTSSVSGEPTSHRRRAAQKRASPGGSEARMAQCVESRGHEVSFEPTAGPLAG